MSTTGPSSQRYRIAELARLTGFTVTTLRFYEDAGVLAPPARTDAGYRVYDDRDVERLRLVGRAKELGCTLEEIAGLVQAWDAYACAPVKHQLRALVLDKVARVRDRIASQVAFAAQLETTAAVLASLPVDGPCDDTCGCATTTAEDLVEAEAAACQPARGSGVPGDPASSVTRFVARGDDGSPPIACDLAASDLATRIVEWRAVLAHVTDRCPAPGGLRMAFGPNPPLADLARLVAAEVACCSFFSMTLRFDRHGVTLEVTDPADGQPLLIALFGAAS